MCGIKTFRKNDRLLHLLKAGKEVCFKEGTIPSSSPGAAVFHFCSKPLVHCLSWCPENSVEPNSLKALPSSSPQTHRLSKGLSQHPASHHHRLSMAFSVGHEAHDPASSAAAFSCSPIPCCCLMKLIIKLQKAMKELLN